VGDSMRVDLTITELDVGGAERCATELACHLAKRGCQVRVIALGPPPPPSRQGLARQLASHSIPLHFLGGRSSWQTAKVLAGVAWSPAIAPMSLRGSSSMPIF